MLVLIKQGNYKIEPDFQSWQTDSVSQVRNTVKGKKVTM